MRRILVFFILSIIILLSGCSKSEVKGTVVTKYGDEFIVKAKIKRDMHEQYVYYDIIGKDLDGGFFTYDHNSSNIPTNPEKEIIEIAGNDDIHVYSLKENLFYVYNKQILWFPNNCDLNQYLSNDYFADNAERKTYLIACHTIISSKRFKYVKVCAPVLLYENDADMVSLIQNWASGIFTDDEIKINTQDGYTTSDLQQWASELLKDKSGY